MSVAAALVYFLGVRADSLSLPSREAISVRRVLHFVIYISVNVTGKQTSVSFCFFSFLLIFCHTQGAFDLS